MLFQIRSVTSADLDDWVAMRQALWVEEVAEDLIALAQEATQLLLQLDSNPVFVVDNMEGVLIGFLEGGLRNYAEGCATSPVAYIEGIYIKPAWQQQGIGKALVAEFETWAKSKGIQEMASDVEISNTLSQDFHQKVGFEKVVSLVAFRKDLI